MQLILVYIILRLIFGTCESRRLAMNGWMTKRFSVSTSCCDWTRMKDCSWNRSFLVVTEML